MDLPGYEEASRLGYTVFAYAGNKQSATYSKGPLSLKVFSDDRATLSTLVGLVEMQISHFSFPHPMFEMFESMIMTAWQGASEADKIRRLRIDADRGDF